MKKGLASAFFIVLVIIGILSAIGLVSSILMIIGTILLVSAGITGLANIGRLKNNLVNWLMKNSPHL